VYPRLRTQRPFVIALFVVQAVHRAALHGLFLAPLSAQQSGCGRLVRDAGVVRETEDVVVGDILMDHGLVVEDLAAVNVVYYHDRVA
jgi:hypothetical protein